MGMPRRPQEYPVHRVFLGRTRQPGRPSCSYPATRAAMASPISEVRRSTDDERSAIAAIAAVSTAAAALGAGEGVAHDALDAERGVDRDLGGDLVRGADAQGAAVARVGALGAFADDDEVDLTGIRQG